MRLWPEGEKEGGSLGLNYRGSKVKNLIVWTVDCIVGSRLPGPSCFMKVGRVLCLPSEALEGSGRERQG